MHFLRSALDYVPRKLGDDCLLELHWMYDRRDLSQVRRDLPAWLAKGAENTQTHRLGGGEHRRDSHLLP
ncbi:transposase-like protein [Bradyrhizobium sp. LB7.1]